MYRRPAQSFARRAQARDTVHPRHRPRGRRRALPEWTTNVAPYPEFPGIHQVGEARQFLRHDVERRGVLLLSRRSVVRAFRALVEPRQKTPADKRSGRVGRLNGFGATSPNWGMPGTACALVVLSAWEAAPTRIATAEADEAAAPASGRTPLGKPSRDARQTGRRSRGDRGCDPRSQDRSGSRQRPRSRAPVRVRGGPSAYLARPDPQPRDR
jgi:hypothetical protein